MATYKIKQGEGKTLQFTVNDSAESPIDITSATLTYTLKKSKNDSIILVQKDDSDFDKTDAATGIAKVAVSETDTDLTPGLYYSELKVYFSSTSVEKSNDLLILIEQAVN